MVTELKRDEHFEFKKALCFHGKALSARKAVVEVLFNL